MMVFNTILFLIFVGPIPTENTQNPHLTFPPPIKSVSNCDILTFELEPNQSKSIRSNPITTLPVPAPAPKPKEHPKTNSIVLAGHHYVETEWKSGLTSEYSTGALTAWANGRNSNGYWDFNLNRWVDSRRKLYHFSWMGHTNWHKFSSYKNRIPTVAHKYHELGTFVKFRYHGHGVIARITDRGPYIGERIWDLNPAASQALHFDGLGMVDYSILRKVK